MAAWAGYPRSYTPGRQRPVQYVVLHYTAGSEGPTSAEAGVAYDKTRTDGVSTHYFTDSAGPALQEVPDGDRAHAALFHGNEIGIQIEICGTRQTREEWLDSTSVATLRTTAALVRELCQRHGLPMRRLSSAQVREAYYNAPDARPRGITDHAGVTMAYPEDGGDHMDVGDGFPWDVFMGMVTEGEDNVKVILTHDANGDTILLYAWTGTWRRIPKGSNPWILQNALDELALAGIGVDQTTWPGPYDFSAQTTLDSWGVEVKACECGEATGLVAHHHKGGDTGEAVPD